MRALHGSRLYKDPLVLTRCPTATVWLHHTSCIAKALRPVPPTLKGDDDGGGGGGDDDDDVGQSPQGCFLGSLRSAFGASGGQLGLNEKWGPLILVSRV